MAADQIEMGTVTSRNQKDGMRFLWRIGNSSFCIHSVASNSFSADEVHKRNGIAFSIVIINSKLGIEYASKHFEYKLGIVESTAPFTVTMDCFGLYFHRAVLNSLFK